MIRHLVFIRFPSTARHEEIAAIFDELRTLVQVVPGMLSFSAGPNISPEGLTNGFTHAFCADFQSAVARDAYLIHPAHKAAGAHLVAAADDGLAGLSVIDIDA